MERTKILEKHNLPNMLSPKERENQITLISMKYIVFIIQNLPQKKTPCSGVLLQMFDDF